MMVVYDTGQFGEGIWGRKLWIGNKCVIKTNNHKINSPPYYYCGVNLGGVETKNQWIDGGE